MCYIAHLLYLFSFKYHLFYLHVGLPAFDISVQLLHKIKMLFYYIYVLSLGKVVKTIMLN